MFIKKFQIQIIRNIIYLMFKHTKLVMLLSVIYLKECQPIFKQNFSDPN